MSEPIKVYHDNLTQPSRALYLFLKINQIPFESIVVTLRSGQFIFNLICANLYSPHPIIR